jgi:hypothetical protein
MATTAGAITTSELLATTFTLTSAAATGGVAPYTYQWYRDTSPGFAIGAPTLLSGETALRLDQTGRTAETHYYYKLRATDSTPVTPVTGDSAEVDVLTPALIATNGRWISG